MPSKSAYEIKIRELEKISKKQEEKIEASKNSSSLVRKEKNYLKKRAGALRKNRSVWKEKCQRIIMLFCRTPLRACLEGYPSNILFLVDI